MKWKYFCIRFGGGGGVQDTKQFQRTKSNLIYSLS